MTINAASGFLSRQRSDSAFHTFCQSVENEARDYTLNLVLPRQIKVPRRIDDGASSHTFTSPRHYYHQQYYEVLDILTGEMARRFDLATFYFFRRWNDFWLTLVMEVVLHHPLVLRRSIV